MAGVALAVHAQPADQGVADNFGQRGEATRAAVGVQQEAEPGALFTV
jgi:hypothetical protein